MDTTREGEELGASYITQRQQLDSSHFLIGTTDDDDDDSREGDEEKPSGFIREQDRFLPIANVARLMKKSIPKTGKIAKDARECVQECVSEFVSFITSEASDRCHQEKRKTINGEDILFAMSSLGFDNYIEPLKLYLQKYREANKGDKVIGAEVGESSAASTTSLAQTLESTAVTPQGATTVVFTYDVGQSASTSNG